MSLTHGHLFDELASYKSEDHERIVPSEPLENDQPAVTSTGHDDDGDGGKTPAHLVQLSLIAHHGVCVLAQRQNIKGSHKRIWW